MLPVIILTIGTKSIPSFFFPVVTFPRSALVREALNAATGPPPIYIYPKAPVAADENIASGATFKPHATATPIVAPTTGDLDERITVNSLRKLSPGIFDN